VDTLRADLKYLAPLLGGKEWAAQVEATLGPALDGLDRQRPFGAILYWQGKGGAPSFLDLPVVYFAPVDEEKRFLKTLERLGGRPRKLDQGGYRLTVPGLPDLFLRFAHRHAYASTREALVRGPLVEPGALVPAGAEKFALAAWLFSERIPRAEFQRSVEESLGALRQAIGEGMGPEMPIGLALKGIGMIIVELQQQLREVSLTLEVDPNRHHLALELGLSPRADCTLARFFEYTGTARSRFRFMSQRGGLSLFAHFPSAPGKVPGTRDLQDQVIEKLGEALDPAHLEMIPPFLEILVSTLQADGLDFGLNHSGGPSGSEQFLLFGLKVQEGRKLDHLLRDTYRALPTTERRGFSLSWNQARHANARIHRLKSLGEEEDVFLAIREDVVFFGVGEPLQGIKEALDHFVNTRTVPTPLFQLDLAPAAFLSKEQYQKAIPKGAAGVDREQVRLRLSLQGGARLRLRVETHAYVLPLLPELLGGLPQ
jgi:hypothetical protein